MEEIRDEVVCEYVIYKDDAPMVTSSRLLLSLSISIYIFCYRAKCTLLIVTIIFVNIQLKKSYFPFFSFFLQTVRTYPPV